MTEESMPFSKRYGHAPISKKIQTSEIDKDLRNGLWNALVKHYFDRMNTNSRSTFKEKYPSVWALLESIWENYYKLPLDEIPYSPFDIFTAIKQNFYRFEWNRIYDFVEFVPNNYRLSQTNTQFRTYCNKILEREFSVFRFVSDKIIPNTSKQEIEEIEKALANPLSSVQTHLETSLTHLSNRENPDYRNSIKESISAVEAIVQKITVNNSTLGDALGIIERKSGIKMPAPLRLAFEKLYGYTNSAEGIRHALTEEPNLEWEDAMFMLVSCSAFINYLTAKADRAGLDLKS